MWSLADRLGKTISDLTVGMVIVLVHVALADREAGRANRMIRSSMVDRTRTWRARISP
jgi:hypothetical protein